MNIVILAVLAYLVIGYTTYKIFWNIVYLSLCNNIQKESSFKGMEVIKLLVNAELRKPKYWHLKRTARSSIILWPVMLIHIFVLLIQRLFKKR